MSDIGRSKVNSEVPFDLLIKREEQKEVGAVVDTYTTITVYSTEFDRVPL